MAKRGNKNAANTEVSQTAVPLVTTWCVVQNESQFPQTHVIMPNFHPLKTRSHGHSDWQVSAQSQL